MKRAAIEFLEDDGKMTALKIRYFDEDGEPSDSDPSVESHSAASMLMSSIGMRAEDFGPLAEEYRQLILRLRGKK